MPRRKAIKGKQGFASMDRELQRSIASKGGRRAHELKAGHEWTSDEAREAGRLGGLAAGRNFRARLAAGVE